MKTSIRVACGAVGALLAAVGAAPAGANALHSVFLSMPSYSESSRVWCGAATGQMIMEGYPTSPCTVLQVDVNDEILVHRLEAIWDADPAGMEGALENLCPPPSGGWTIYDRTDPAQLMFSVAYWMTRRQYPAAVVLNTLTHNEIATHEEHWVAVKGIVTDVDPTTNTTVNLQHVWFVDPVATVFGGPPIERFVSAATWYGELQPVTKATSSYFGKYVAVIEPPQVTGIAKVVLEPLIGRLIDPEKALVFARRWIEEYGLAELEPYRLLGTGQAQAPLLVNREQGGYYLIPFAAQGEAAGAAVLVNAYTGGFQEAGAFAPRRFLSREQAVELAGKAAGVDPAKASAELVFLQGSGGAAKYSPTWKVRLAEQVVGVSQGGEARLGLTDEIFAVRVGARSLGGIAGKPGRLWALDAGSGELLEVHPGSGAVLARRGLDLERPRGLAFDGERLWVAEPGAKAIHAFDAKSGERARSIPLEVPPEKGFESLAALAWDGSHLWTAIAAGFSSSINQVDPATGKILRSYFADCDPRGLAVSGDRVWTLCAHGAARRPTVDERTLAADEKAVQASRRLVKQAEGASPAGLTFDGEFLWYIDSVDNRAVRFTTGESAGQ